MTKEQAIEMFKTEWWKTKTTQEIVAFQLYEPLLCMDFGDFHLAVEKALGRSVWTHEFIDNKKLQAEFEGKCGKPSIDEIVNMLPADKTIIVKHGGLKWQR